MNIIFMLVCGETKKYLSGLITSLKSYYTKENGDNDKEKEEEDHCNCLDDDFGVYVW